MFNVGPLELVVLAIVGLVVIGPDKLPNFARDAARLIRSLRDMATGARNQLRDELGPEFADVDLRNLNPRTAIQRAVLGDEFELDRFDLRRYNPRTAAQDLLFGPDGDDDATTGSVNGGGKPVSFDKRTGPSTETPSAEGRAQGSRPRPRPRPTTPSAPHDDAT